MILLSIITEKTDVSSANILKLYRRPSGKSLMKIRKNKGPRMEPWGTPVNTCSQVEK